MAPQACPFCTSLDVRPLSVPGVTLTGYSCHDCLRTFYPNPPKGADERERPQVRRKAPRAHKH
jgi:transposase-like protein